MTLRTLWKTATNAMLLAICCAATTAHADKQETASDSAGSEACATPASSLSGQDEKSVPYKRPSFHPPIIDGSKANTKESKQVQSQAVKPKWTPSVLKDVNDQFETKKLPELNPIQTDVQTDSEDNSIESLGPELNAPGTISAPSVLESPVPGTDSATPETLELAPGDIPAPSAPIPANEFSEFNFSDDGCSDLTTRFPVRKGRSGLLRPLRSRKNSSEWSSDRETALRQWQMPHQAIPEPAGIGSHYLQHGTGISEGQTQPVENASNVPGLSPPNNIPVKSAASGPSSQVTQLPGSRVPAQSGSEDSSSNGIVIHPPIVQPFNRNQHTFVIENKGEAEAKDVVIEITVQAGDRIVAALPANSVTSDQVSMFKFPRIAPGESIPIHVTAVSGDSSPVEFAASLISRAVYSFHIHDGQQQAKLSSVSYVNEKQLPNANHVDNGDGPVRVTNPFFGTQQPTRSNQAFRNGQFQGRKNR